MTAVINVKRFFTNDFYFNLYLQHFVTFVMPGWSSLWRVGIKYFVWILDMWTARSLCVNCCTS